MSCLRFALVAGFLALTPALASAQMPEVDPSGNPPPTESTPPPATPYQTPAQQGATRPPAPPQPEARSDSSGYYHYDGALGGGPRYGPRANGPVPAAHVVNAGDTLWDITSYYFNNPWQWPKVWAKNPQIKDPHWIYPGDEISLLVDGDGKVTVAAAKHVDGDKPAASAAAAPATARTPRPAARTAQVTLRRLAFLAADGLEVGATIDGSPRARMMLSAGDPVYLEPLPGTRLEAGQTYAIYDESEKVVHPDSGKVLGSYVKVLGELEITEAREGERAVAVIRQSNDVIERGDRVGPLKRTFSSVSPKKGTQKVKGTIVATLQSDQLIGAEQIVVIDRGSTHGLAVGNPLYVIRRGDGYAPVMGGSSLVGQNDEGYPARIIGQILVIDVGTSTAIAVVTTASQEAGVGDHVLLSP